MDVPHLAILTGSIGVILNCFNFAVDTIAEHHGCNPTEKYPTVAKYAPVVLRAGAEQFQKFMDTRACVFYYVHYRAAYCVELVIVNKITNIEEERWKYPFDNDIENDELNIYQYNLNTMAYINNVVNCFKNYTADYTFKLLLHF